jgi:UDP-glucose 4-epimerase
MIYLVTGGAGFIGSHLVEALLGMGRRVRVFDNFSTGRRDNLTPFSPQPEIVEGDLTDADAVQRATKDVQFVFHLGALASVQASVDNPLLSHHICATGTLHVLDAARKSGVRRVVFAGSASAYGIPAGPVQSETDGLRALSPYSAAKLAGEFYAQACAASYGLEAVSVRFFNIFGPRQRADSPYSGVIAIFTNIMTSGKVPAIYGDGLQSRDFTYVTDAVQALIKASEKAGVSGKVYNVGTGRSTSVLDLVNALNKLLGTNITPKHLPERAGDIKHSRADISAARRELGYEPAMSFEEGLRRTLEWYRSCSTPK